MGMTDSRHIFLSSFKKFYLERTSLLWIFAEKYLELIFAEKYLELKNN